MNRVPLYNPTVSPLHVGGVVIPSGDTRMVDVALIPPYLRQAPVEAALEPPADPIAALLSGKAADVIAALPGLSDEDLAAAQNAEYVGKARKSVLEAAAALRLERAAAADLAAGDTTGDATEVGDDAEAED